ncbi:MAG TPA: SDR family NAD(P)-dependent oxidoreductase, partial [Solirubrobacteraceae bacterium]|nr:SDR family NAD(P)-dependent oxidoreductase [Solirubrobacteraceae bacterium]
MNRSSFSGQAGIVTGAGSGIGRAIAEAFAAAGAGVGVLDVAGAAEAAEAIGGSAFAVTCDVTDTDAVTAAFRDVNARFGRLDFLINSAGIRQLAPIL